MKKILFSGVLLMFLSCLFSLKAEAATLSFATDKTAFFPGDEFSADVHIDSEGVGINAAQVTIKFPPEILEITSVSREESVFNFWLQEPVFSNTEGKLDFVGGSTSGLTGQSLNVLKINFRAKSIGKVDMVFTDAAVTASDGSGTNVLSGTSGLSFDILARGIPQKSPTQIIAREPIPSQNLPAKPELTIPLYPDSSKWYNVSSSFLVTWKLPLDIINVATSVSKDPNGIPPSGEGLFDNKLMPALADGIWYVHVQFRNNINWGPVAHYRIGIDTLPPASFEIDSSLDTPTDDPAPEIKFVANDQLSGISKYRFAINGTILESLEPKIKLPLQKPGQKTIVISAFDKAGNAVEIRRNFEILPIEPPTVVNYSHEIYIGEGGFNISGTAKTDRVIIASLIQNNSETIISKRVRPDDNGNWALSFEEASQRRKYSIEVIAEDPRGAQSLPIMIGPIVPKNRPIVSVLGIQISQFGFFMGLTIILIVGFGAGIIFYKFTGKRRARQIIIAERDVVAAFNRLNEDVDAIIKTYRDGVIEEREKDEIKFHAAKIKKNIETMKRYLIENISEIKK